MNIESGERRAVEVFNIASWGHLPLIFCHIRKRCTKNVPCWEMKNCYKENPGMTSLFLLFLFWSLLLSVIILTPLTLCSNSILLYSPWHSTHFLLTAFQGVTHSWVVLYTRLKGSTIAATVDSSIFNIQLKIKNENIILNELRDNNALPG